jgi:hypothetical protein
MKHKVKKISVLKEASEEMGATEYLGIEQAKSSRADTLKRLKDMK